MNRRQLLAGLCAAALPKPKAEPDWVVVEAWVEDITDVYVYDDVLRYTQIFRKTIEITSTKAILKLQPHDPPWREVKQPILEWNDLP